MDVVFYIEVWTFLFTYIYVQLGKKLAIDISFWCVSISFCVGVCVIAYVFIIYLYVCFLLITCL